MSTDTRGTQITSITRGPRQTNVELLRIVAMLMVMIGHANFWSQGMISGGEMHADFVGGATRCFLESWTVVAVDIFVMISGWFGIRASWRGLASFLFQCGFFFFGTAAVMVLMGRTALTPGLVLSCVTGSWFVLSYMALYILSPVLNAFIRGASRRQMEWVLVLFFIFQTAYGPWDTARFIIGGYSVFSFIGLYLLASYLRTYISGSYRGGYLVWLAVALGTFAVDGSVVTACFWTGWTSAVWHVYRYINPLVIIGAAAMLMCFTRIKVKYSPVINWVAASSFAAYLLHQAPTIGRPVYQPLMQWLYTSFSGVECLGVMFGVIVAIFLLAVVLDQPRRWLWTHIARFFSKDTI